jgi:hypothetical protein
MTIFYCIRFEPSLFIASYDSQGYDGGFRPRLHTGKELSSKFRFAYNLSTRTNRKPHFEQYFYFCMRICFRRNLFTEPLPISGSGIFANLAVAAQQRLYTLHCSLLKALCPEWSTGVPPFLLFRELCLVSSSSPWFGIHGDYSPTASATPSLRALVPSVSVKGCQSVQF